LLLGLALAAQTAQPAASTAAIQSHLLPDLSGYRTVATAITTQVVRTAKATVGQSGYLGVSVAADTRGKLIVEEVEADSPAARAGAQPGDVLARLGGRPVKTAAEVRELLQSKSPGETVKLAIERKRKSLELTATLGATSRPMKTGSQRLTLGVRLKEADKGEGAAIEQVTSDSPASRAGLKAGDLLLRLDGAPITTREYVRERLDEKQAGDIVKLSLSRDGEEREVEAKLAVSDTSPSGNVARNLWKRDVYRLAVILVEYPDVKHNSRISTDDWAEFLFSTASYADKTNGTGQAVYGSVNDYYREVSAGAFHVEGKVFDWIEVSRKRGDYAQGTNANNKSVFFDEALDLLREREGREALKEIDGLLFLHAGERVNTSNRGGLYWPHMGGTTFRGKRWNYFICPEGGKRMASISVFCHEFGHMLGLPDLYARPENPGSEGLGVWCCMSQENGGGRPQHFSAWCKEQLGWLRPAVIDPAVKQKLVLAPIERSTNECFKVLARPDGSEYFLLENRRRTNFDRTLPAEGLLIWRVVGGKPILEESHGVEGASGPRVFPTSVPFPSRANNAFTPYTTPSSRSLLGGGAPVHLTNIRQLADGRIAFQIGYEYE
ncbi:MAG TPA: M6 family metalloprotease domain-containing protein, partial [Verrucomicrobiae bacterium]